MNKRIRYSFAAADVNIDWRSEILQSHLTIENNSMRGMDYDITVVSCECITLTYLLLIIPMYYCCCRMYKVFIEKCFRLMIAYTGQLVPFLITTLICPECGHACGPDVDELEQCDHDWNDSKNNYKTMRQFFPITLAKQ